MRNYSLRLLSGVIATAVLASFGARSARALLSPLGVAIAGPVEFPPESFTIVGARVSALWGDHRDVWGLDVGAVGNVTDGSFVGLGVSGLFNYNRGTATVVFLQAAGVANVNVNKARIVGIQLAAGLNDNRAESSLVGLQLALLNLSQYTQIYGFQVGLYNTARDVYGFQIGLINSTQALHGLQVGLVNLNQAGPLAMAPILNVGF